MSMLVHHSESFWHRQALSLFDQMLPEKSVSVPKAAVSTTVPLGASAAAEHQVRQMSVIYIVLQFDDCYYLEIHICCYIADWSRLAARLSKSSLFPHCCSAFRETWRGEYSITIIIWSDLKIYTDFLFNFEVNRVLFHQYVKVYAPKANRNLDCFCEDTPITSNGKLLAKQAASTLASIVSIKKIDRICICFIIVLDNKIE